jgi:hypothetical protein
LFKTGLTRAAAQGWEIGLGLSVSASQREKKSFLVFRNGKEQELSRAETQRRRERKSEKLSASAGEEIFSLFEEGRGKEKALTRAVAQGRRGGEPETTQRLCGKISLCLV